MKMIMHFSAMIIHADDHFLRGPHEDDSVCQEGWPFYGMIKLITNRMQEGG